MTLSSSLIVLGRGVRKDGSLGLIARARVDRALELFAMGVAPRVIFSGRSALMAEDIPAVTEAEAMAAYARAHGLPPVATFIEDQSRDTIGNAYFVRRRWLEPNGWKSIRVVTTDYHIPRAAWIFRKVLGPEYDVSFSAAHSDRFAASVASRARDESDIAAFLAGWLGSIPDGDMDAVARLIEHDHPGYAASPTMTKAELKERVDAIARSRRAAEHRAAPAIVRSLEERMADL
ncbi:MAG TPA: YdcF family protein [Gemmatimonadaceae bacterium]|nr:YdcF family protein [Gemmatimonadaceae bacterium]